MVHRLEPARAGLPLRCGLRSGRDGALRMVGAPIDGIRAATRPIQLWVHPAADRPRVELGRAVCRGADPALSERRAVPLYTDYLWLAGSNPWRDAAHTGDRSD